MVCCVGAELLSIRRSIISTISLFIFMMPRTFCSIPPFLSHLQVNALFEECSSMVSDGHDTLALCNLDNFKDRLQAEARALLSFSTVCAHTRPILECRGSARLAGVC